MAEAATEQPRIGSTVAGKYRLSRVLGRGGMGVVYEAEHLVTSRKVAIKVMHPESEVGADAARRFLNEASAAGKIQHPNVVEVLDAGQDPADGSLFIVLELLTGIDLATYLMRYERLLPGETLTVVCQVLQALVVAHRAGIVHRDIKPENIFLARQQSGETHVKIVDFGISKAIHPEQNVPLSITQTNTTVGTPHYMSPEQAKGEPIDTRADIWALGVVMYECLTGRLPYDGENFNIQIVNVVTGTHQPARDFGVDAELSTVIDRCLEKDRTRRYARAADMLADLREYVDRHPGISVRAALLMEPRVQGPVIASARPSDPTTPISLDPAAARLISVTGADTERQLPVFPGMVPIDEEHHADNAPTTVRAIVADGSAPRPLSQRPGALSNRPPPPLEVSADADGSGAWASTGHRSRGGLFLAAGLVLVAAGTGAGFALVSSGHRAPVAPEAAANRVTLHFVGIHPRARALVGATPYYSDTAFAPRGLEPMTVRIEASGFVPLDFTIVPDRDQNVALPPMQAAAPPLPAVPTPTPAVAPAPPAPVHPPAVPVAASPLPPPSPPVPSPTPSLAPPMARTSAPLTVVATVPRASSTVAPRRAPPPGSAMLSVGATPRCSVSVDGRFVAMTPVFSRALSPGTHRVECARAGERPVVREILLTPGQSQRLIF